MYWWYTGIVLIGIYIIFVCSPSEPHFQACPSLWLNYEGKCYFFSEEERSWTSSQEFCASQQSTLAVIKNEQEKAFVLRYINDIGHWIGLQKDSDQTWRWEYGQEFKNMLEVEEKNGKCAFLRTDFAVSDCHVARKWICSKPDTCTRSKECNGGVKSQWKLW